MQKFNTKEMAIHNFTLALTFNAKEVSTLLSVTEALLVYEHTKLLLEGENLLLNSYKRIYQKESKNGVIITVFEFL